MHPFLFFILAVLTPFGLFLCLLGPIYLSMCGAVFSVYHQSVGNEALLMKLPDIFYVIGVYGQLFSYWKSHIMAVPFFQYTVPIAIIPVASIFLTIWLTRKFVWKMGNVFQVNVLSE